MCYLQVAPFGKHRLVLFSMDSDPYVIIPFLPKFLRCAPNCRKMNTNFA